MRIEFRKLSDDQHELAIVRANGAPESVVCETRSTLAHDLLHYAVEAEAGLAGGFWARLAAGRTLAEMNDRGGGMGAGAGDAAAAAELAAIERLVGALHRVTKGQAAGDLVAGLRRFAASLGTTIPPWLTEPLVEAVEGRMRRLVGRWRATRHGEAMDLDWPA